MARRYDTRTTIFSPEGRLHQVEYAMEAISQAGSCLGICASDGIVLAAEVRNSNKLLCNEVFQDKLFKIANHICCGIAGINADANILVQEMRLIAQRFMYSHGAPIPLEQLVAHLCDIKHAYTQHGGKRPFGVSILYMGWDEHYNFQLYQSDPSGNYSGWNGTSVGSQFNSANALLKSELSSKYDENKQPKADFTVQEAQKIAIHVLAKTLDGSKITPEQVELAMLRRVQQENGQFELVLHMLTKECIETLIKAHAENEQAKQGETKAE